MAARNAYIVELQSCTNQRNRLCTSVLHAEYVHPWYHLIGDAEALRNPIAELSCHVLGVGTWVFRQDQKRDKMSEENKITAMSECTVNVKPRYVSEKLPMCSSSSAGWFCSITLRRSTKSFPFFEAWARRLPLATVCLPHSCNNLNTRHNHSWIEGRTVDMMEHVSCIQHQCQCQWQFHCII